MLQFSSFIFVGCDGANAILALFKTTGSHLFDYINFIFIVKGPMRVNYNCLFRSQRHVAVRLITVLLICGTKFIVSLGGETLVLRNLALDALYLTQNELPEYIGGHASPALLENEPEDRIIKETFRLGANCIKHALVLILSN